MLSDSDYAAVAATGGKVTAFCGFNWSSPDDEEEVEAEEKVVDNPRLSMEPVNPHHPRFLRSHLPASDVTPVVSSVSAPEVDERDFGEEEEEVESVERTRPTAAPHRPPFEPYESLQDQLARMRTLRAEVPSYAEAIMLQGSRLVDFAAAGNIIRIMEIVHGSEPGELLYWHSSKMFLAGCAGGHADVVKFMLGNGFDARLKTVCDCLHEAVGASDPARALETAALLLSAGVDVNAQRKPDCWSPLHVACGKGRPALVNLLLKHGADPSSVAEDDATPLSVLASASASGDIGAGDSVVIEAALKSAGGVFGRRSSDASSTPTPLVQQAAAGGAGGHSGFVSTSAGRRPGLDLCTEDSDED